MNRFLVAFERNYGEGPLIRFSVEKLEKDSHGLPEHPRISYSTIFFFIAEIEAQTTEEVMENLSILSLRGVISPNALPIPKEWKIEGLYYLGRITIINGLPYVVNPYIGSAVPVHGKDFYLIEL